MIREIEMEKIMLARDRDGHLLNPRGEGFTSVDLQESFSVSGQQEEIEVLELADGTFLLLDGHRRVQAASALGWKTIRALIKDIGMVTDEAVLLRMLTSDMHVSFKPTQLAEGIRRLMLGRKWSVERVAKLRGMKVEKVRLYLDLLEAPQSVRDRVDGGEMSLSAFAALRDKPVEIQEKAAALDKPTRSAVTRLARQEAGRDANAGQMADLLAQMAAEDHQAVRRFYEISAEIEAEWFELSLPEQEGILERLARLNAFMEEACVSV
jgi:ParB-like chromosome segregation protein Spo0J